MNLRGGMQLTSWFLCVNICYWKFSKRADFSRIKWFVFLQHRNSWFCPGQETASSESKRTPQAVYWLRHLELTLLVSEIVKRWVVIQFPSFFHEKNWIVQAQLWSDQVQTCGDLRVILCSASESSLQTAFTHHQIR